MGENHRQGLFLNEAIPNLGDNRRNGICQKPRLSQACKLLVRKSGLLLYSVEGLNHVACSIMNIIKTRTYTNSGVTE